MRRHPNFTPTYLGFCIESLNSVLNVKVLVGAFNQEIDCEILANLRFKLYYIHVNLWRRRAAGALNPAQATAPGAAAWTGGTGSSSRGCSASSAGRSSTQSCHVDNNNFELVLGDRDQIVNSEHRWGSSLMQLLLHRTVPGHSISICCNLLQY